MSNNFYPYEYFSGANIFITVDGQPVLEAAGISYTEMDSMQPIYGYSSRMFDAVAPGQKIIQGSLVINQVHNDYLFDSIVRGRRISGEPMAVDPMTAPYLDEHGMPLDDGSEYQYDANTFNVGDVWRDSTSVSGKYNLSSTGYSGYPSTSSGGLGGDVNLVTSALETKYWENEIVDGEYLPGRPPTRMTDPSLLGPTNIEIQFANQFAVVLWSCFFVSRNSGIQIDENVILEEHTFFARSSSTKDLDY